MIVIGLAASNGFAGAGTVLRSRLVSVAPPVSGSLIVGRAVCNGAVWLLSDDQALTGISPAALHAVVRKIGGLREQDRPWGLACSSDGALWTLAEPRSLARIASTGQVSERIALPFPAVALFAAGGRLLFQAAPPVVGAPLLAARPPGHPERQQAWPGLLGRASKARTDLFARNLVACGLGNHGELPCWFADQAAVEVSDGTRTRRLSWPFVQGADIDPEAPIRDVALAPGGRAWILATSRQFVNGRRSSGRILLAVNGQELARLDLVPEVRLIIAADQVTCLLLTVNGELLEVRAQ